MGKLVNSRQLREFLDNMPRSTFYRWRKLKIICAPVNKRGAPKWDLDEVKERMKTKKSAA